MGNGGVPGDVRRSPREEMREAMADITESPEWSALAEHQAALAGRHLRELFADDPGRAARMAVTAGDLYLDYSSTGSPTRR